MYAKTHYIGNKPLHMQTPIRDANRFARNADASKKHFSWRLQYGLRMKLGNTFVTSQQTTV